MKPFFIVFLLLAISFCTCASNEMPSEKVIPVAKPTVSVVPEKPKVELPWIPDLAKEYIPVLKNLMKDVWPTLSKKDSMPAQVEQETCISLKHSKCWSPKAELKTSREYGFGLGQITIAYDAKGAVRFNNFEGIKKLDSSLKGWEWEDRYNPEMQLRALLVYDKYLYNSIPKGSDEYNKLAFTFCAYNGGLGGLLQDRQLTQSKGGDPNKWFGDNNVSVNSYKAKTKVGGYGQSFFEINRGYVDNILNKRNQKYTPYMEE